MLEVLINKNRVVWGQGEDRIGAGVKPEVVEYLTQAYVTLNAINARKNAINRHADPEAFKSALREYQAQQYEMEAEANRLQFGEK